MTGQLDSLKKKEEWLAAHRKIGIITATCRKTKIQRSTVYFWMDNDPEFKAAAANAEQEAVELLEAEARRRAEKGVLKPVFYKGERCGTIREYSDSLMMFIIKAKKPEYRDRVTTTLETPPGGIDINTYTMTPEERRARIDELIAKRGDGTIPAVGTRTEVQERARTKAEP
jgi:alkanesulfonate monooxygenase SsuD/methylene tetrahydromethanopterin reductase-like flavin-dependent oxidoreductase (luciferase family)